MTTKRTILSEKELNLIENLILKYGSVVSFNDIYNELKRKITRQAMRNLVNKLTKNGWLVRIKKGTYFISSIESRGFNNLSPFKIAQILLKNSYISFEAALQYHGMFDQFLKTVTSVALKKYKTSEIQGISYKFIKTKKSLFYGYEEKNIENCLVKIATPEKALLDLLNYSRNSYVIDLILEKLKEHKKDLKIESFQRLIKKQSVTVQRLVGFLFDKANIDSSYFYHLVKNKKNCSHMTNDSNLFNSKWRLYYLKHFD